MKRYLLFFGENYYPLGGIDDFKGSFDSLNELTTKLIEVIKEDIEYNRYTFSNAKKLLDWFDYHYWAHYYDMESNQKTSIDFNELNLQSISDAYISNTK